ncbi:hypothetical protein [Flavobacterium alkalisoli]|uniref:hypothetical protein n=1 Tax=Flavobacterium alkalisoli TaxID=2602769 RepID=UPI00143D4103|nr:hypothetical protein [Flavobacterium alkalisoli]
MLNFFIKTIVTAVSLGVVVTASYLIGGYTITIGALMCVIIGIGITLLWKLKI